MRPCYVVDGVYPVRVRFLRCLRNGYGAGRNRHVPRRPCHRLMGSFMAGLRGVRPATWKAIGGSLAAILIVAGLFVVGAL